MCLTVIRCDRGKPIRKQAMWDRPFFHEGMRDFQDRYDGRRVAEAIEGKRKHYEFWDDRRS
jgi:hypothetical protein